MLCRAILRVCVAVTILAGGVLHRHDASAQTTDIPFCSALSDPAVYKQPGNEDFATIIQGLDGWVFRSQFDFKSRFRLKDTTKDSFRRLNEAFKYNGSDFVIVMLPTRGITAASNIPSSYSANYDAQQAKRGYLRMLNDIRATGIIVPDMSDVDTVEDYFLKDDNHWTPSGAKFTAETTARAIKKIPAYADIPKLAFKTQMLQQRENVPHQFTDFANKICGTSIKTLPIEEYPSTMEATSDVTEQDLFADKPLPKIALLGTSNSRNPEPSYANFIGFLQESLGADISNEAISGGSMQGSISKYLMTGRYLESKPSIVLWELNAYYGLNRSEFLREIIPAVYGECSDQAALESNSGQVNKKDTPLFKDLAKKNYISHKYYLALNLSDKMQDDIKLRFTHVDGNTDTIELERSERSFSGDNPGLFFAELNDEIKSPLLKIDLDLKNGSGTYSAKICRTPESTKIVSTQQQDISPKKKSIFSSLASKFAFFRDYSIRPISQEATASQNPEPVMPDLTGYTKQAILEEIPPLTKGNVTLGNMEGAAVLKNFAINKRLAEFQEIQKTKIPQAIHIRSGVYDFASLMEELKGTQAIVERDEGYVLQLPIALYPETALILKDLSKPLLMSQEKGAFIASAGNLFIANSTIIGWSEDNKKPAILNDTHTNFRPFITMWDGTELYITGSTLKNLGYNSTKSYGLTLSTSEVIQYAFEDQYGDLPAPTGWITESAFEGFYFGFYSYEAADVVILKNRYKDNVIYGIDPHDRSERLIIAYNNVTGSKKKHGIILSREVNNSFIIYNETTGNQGSGIMLDRNCVNTVIAHNNSRSNHGDGITVYESPNNLLYNNVVERNDGGGVRIRNSWNITVQEGKNRLNKDFGFLVYKDPLTGTERDFQQDPVVPRAGAKFADVEMEYNAGLLKTEGIESIIFENINLENSTLNKYAFGGDLSRHENKLRNYMREPVTLEITSGM